MWGAGFRPQLLPPSLEAKPSGILGTWNYFGREAGCPCITEMDVGGTGNAVVIVTSRNRKCRLSGGGFR